MSLQIQNWNAILLLGLEIINCHTIKGTRKEAIHAFSLCKFLDVRQYACAKDSTNIMSDDMFVIWSYNFDQTNQASEYRGFGCICFWLWTSNHLIVIDCQWQFPLWTGIARLDGGRGGVCVCMCVCVYVCWCWPLPGCFGPFFTKK